MVFLSQPILSSSAAPPPNLNEAFVEEMKSTGIPLSHEVEDRVFRGHGEPLPTKPPSNSNLQFTLDVALLQSGSAPSALRSALSSHSHWMHSECGPVADYCSRGASEVLQ